MVKKRYNGIKYLSQMGKTFDTYGKLHHCEIVDRFKNVQRP